MIWKRSVVFPERRTPLRTTISPVSRYFRILVKYFSRQIPASKGPALYQGLRATRRSRIEGIRFVGLCTSINVCFHQGIIELTGRTPGVFFRRHTGIPSPCRQLPVLESSLLSSARRWHRRLSSSVLRNSGKRARRSPPGRTPGVYPPAPPQNRRNTSAIVITFAAMLAAYVIREILTPNRPKSER